jgi:hypothetical protein
MLEYIKNVLKKVSFDESLFQKELKKSEKWLDPNEQNELKQWVGSNFNENIKKEVFD